MRISFIPPAIHGLIDYLAVIFLALSPTLFELSGFVSSITYVLAVVHFLLTVLTDFSAGWVKLIPLRAHGLIELVLGIVLLFLPQIFGFSDMPAESNFYQGFGIAVLVVWVLSDYRK